MSNRGVEEFGRALTAALTAQGLSQADLAAKVTARLEQSVTPAAVSQWAGGQHEPGRDKVFAIEQCLELRPGTLSRHLGYLPATARPVRSVLDAIEADPALDGTARAMLKAAYREATK